MKKYDLMHQINVRGTFAVSKACIPYLCRTGGHILMLSPPLIMRPEWFGPHTAYSMSKYGMSMTVLGLAEELKGAGVAVNALWPRTLILTAALQAIDPSQLDQMQQQSRSPAIVADAAYAVLCQPTSFTGNFLIDEQVLTSQGIRSFHHYSIVPKGNPATDLFVDRDYRGRNPPQQILSRNAKL